MSKISLLSVLELPDKRRWKFRYLQDSLTRCYNQKLYVDVEVRIQDKIFKAHKNVLAFYSPIFQKSFYGTKTPSSVCVINSITPEGFEILLRFLYCSHIPEKANSDYLVEACFAARTLQMVGIEEKLINYILSKIEPATSGGSIVGEDFWSFLKKSRSLKLRELEEKLLKFAEDHFTSILYSKDFAKADSEIIKLVLNKKPLKVSDGCVLERITHWKDSNRNLKLLDLSVQELLAYVNFEKLTPKEFYNIVSKQDDLMSAQDSLDILMHLVDPTVCSLPKWCYIGDKSSNISANILLSPQTVNLGDWSKIDKFKSLEDVWPTNDLSSKGDWSHFQSQEDLSRIPYVENPKKRNGRKPSAGALSHGKSLWESFYQMLEEGLFPDVTLVAKDQTKIHAHRLILALGSDVFANMLYGSAPVNTVICKESADELKTMLRYFYGCVERISFKTISTSLDSILRKAELAVKYQCYPLLQACNNAFLPISVDPCLFWKLLQHTDKLVKCKINTTVLMKYAMVSTKEIFDHASFYKASQNSLVKVLKSDYLNMAECDILEYVAKWLKINANIFPTDQSRKELFKNIRFEALNAEQFFVFLKKHDHIFLKEDSFAILTFLFRQSSENRLPGWCYCGPLRSIFYDISTKIGTNTSIPWKSSPEKGRNTFKCTYTVAISNNASKCQVQFLEFSLKVNLPKATKCKDCKCSVTIKPDDGSTILCFDDLQIVPYQRFLLPVSFSLDNQKRKINFDIHVHAKDYHKFYFIKDQRMTFGNVVIEAKSGMNCLSDAIIDNLTSERVRIPDHLLSENSYTAVPTENFFKVIPEVTFLC